ncbi:MAG: hypothetical protein JWN08_1588, partial [Frankiales bacterium]|nr:hypothetical protein [Frankiales bacterium]
MLLEAVPREQGQPGERLGVRDEPRTPAGTAERERPVASDRQAGTTGRRGHHGGRFAADVALAQADQPGGDPAGRSARARRTTASPSCNATTTSRAVEQPGGGLRAVEHQVRVGLEQRPVLAAGRLALGRVDDHHRPTTGVERRLQLADEREAAAAASAKARVGDLLQQVLRLPGRAVDRERAGPGLRPRRTGQQPPPLRHEPPP